MSRYPELDGIRGSAFLLVLMGHIFSTNTRILKYIVGVPKFGVWMFFVLSSFLLTNYFLSNPDRVFQPIEWLNYIVRRFLRIYPMYVVVLFVYYLYHHEINSPIIILKHLVLQQGLLQFWTMPVEFTFYFLLPIVVLVLVFVCRMNLKIAITLAAIFIAIHQMIIPYTKSVANSIHVFQYLPVFIMGCLGSLIHYKLCEVKIGSISKAWLDLLSVIIIAGLILVTPYPMIHIFGQMPDQYLINKFIFVGFACLLLILSIVHGRFVKKLFSNAVMRFLGKISFSGYLMHWLFIQIIIGQYFKSLTFVSGLITFFLTIICSTITFYLIERPCMRINLLKFKKQKIQSTAAQ